MNRREAYISMMNRNKIMHDSYREGEHCMFDETTGRFCMCNEEGMHPIFEEMLPEDGYTTLKEKVKKTVYMNIYKNDVDAMLSQESAKLGRGSNCIATTSVEIEYYKGEGL